MCGAISLAASAALRSGAGLVTVATFEHCCDVVAGLQPCYMTLPLATDAQQTLSPAARDQIASFAFDCLACGPGFGQTSDVVDLVTWLYRSVATPMVIDADGINALACAGTNLGAHAGPRILTPHPGEFRRLVGNSSLSIQGCRQLARRLAREHDLVLLVKGHQTLVTDGQEDFENTTGNPGMATGGTGDVLTGVITALVCQRLSPWEAAQLGVHVHGLAGDLAAEKCGVVSLIASDLIDYLPHAFRKLGFST
jgi:NAD(P)H-hydrate epimerase